MKHASLALLLALNALSVAPCHAGLPHGVAAGETTPTSVLLWTRSDTSGLVRFELALDPAFAQIVASQSATVIEVDRPVKVTLSGLSQATKYWYRAIDETGSQATGTFRTPCTWGRAGFRMGVSGDWRGELTPLPSIRNAATRDLDMFMCLGDTVYADVSSPAVPAPQASSIAEFRAKHGENLSERFGLNVLRELRQSTSVFAMIDDHEVTNDFAGAAPAGSDPRFGPSANAFLNGTDLYRNGLQAFQEYHPISERVWSGTGDARMDGQPDLYRTRRFGDDAQFFLVDARSFRDQPLPPADPANTATWPGYIASTYTPGRTMLGQAQFNRLAADLLSAEMSGVTWKFVMVSQPTQLFGVLQASDRFEGYALERANLLGFIKQQGIRNVVFVAADVHGTMVNNLTFPGGPGGAHVDSGAWEISTGSGAYAPPFGPTVAGIAAGLGLPGTIPLSVYLSLPPATQEAYIAGLINAQVVPLGYSALGLADSGIAFSQQVGGPTVTNNFSWTEFDVDALTQRLTVTTWGIPWYDANTLLAAPALITALQPGVLQRFTVEPKVATCPGDIDRSGSVDAGDIAAMLLCWGDAEPLADLDASGSVDSADLALLLMLFGDCP